VKRLCAAVPLACARELAAAGLHHIDVGTSGGVAGQERGYCLMIGGDHDVVKRLEPIFIALAPGAGTAKRTPGRSGGHADAEQGFLHCGPHGAGHFVKMVHNGIEYGVMAAYAEGLNILRNANVGKSVQTADAETTPLRETRSTPACIRRRTSRLSGSAIWSNSIPRRC